MYSKDSLQPLYLRGLTRAKELRSIRAPFRAFLQSGHPVSTQQRSIHYRVEQVLSCLACMLWPSDLVAAVRTCLVWRSYTSQLFDFRVMIQEICNMYIPRYLCTFKVPNVLQINLNTYLLTYLFTVRTAVCIRYKNIPILCK